MKSILYVTTLPIENGGKADGGVATHSLQLITKAKDHYKVGLYANIKELKKLKGITLHKGDNKLIKVLKSIAGLLLVNKKKLKRIYFLTFRDKLKVLYHYYNLRDIISNYDVIHVHSLHDDTITALSLMEYRPRVVVTDHGFWQAEIERKIKKVRHNSFSVDNVIFISDFAKTKHEQYGLSTDNLVKIYNPLMFNLSPLYDKESIKKKLNIDMNSKVLFFSGVSDPVNRKGLDIVLNSISSDKYLRENIYLIIVTNEEGLKYIDQFSNIKNIIALRPMPYKEVVELYSISDLFILPSRSESFGLVYIEALSYGTPVIGFDKVVSEFKELYSPLYIGETFNPNLEKESDLVKKINKVLSNNVDKMELRRKTNSLFSWDKLFTEFIKVYEDVNEK